MTNIRKIMLVIGVALALTIIDVVPSVARAPLTSSINTYHMGLLTPIRSLGLPSLPHSADVSAELPVVKIPGSYGVEVNLLPSLKNIFADIPLNMANKLTAYFVQMDQTTGFYLIGPRGMKGKAVLGTNGLFGVFLKNSNASIELDAPGGEVITAWSMAAPFFPSARKSLDQNGLGLKQKSIFHATTKRLNASTTLFAFIDQHGQKVAGYNFYQSEWYSSAFGSSAQMIYRADNTDWKFAPWVLNAGIVVLDNIGEPQMGGQVIHLGATPKVINGPYFPTDSALQINHHIVWLQNNVYVQRGSTSAPHSRFPIAPFSLMIGAYRKGKLLPNSALVLALIPWVQSFMANNQPLYNYPMLLHPTEGRYLPYIESWAGYGMNQPAINDLYVFDLKSHKNRLITTFSLFGGYFFAVGTSGSHLAYDQSGINNATGNFGHNIWLVNLKTGKAIHLPLSDLRGHMVKATMNGQPIRIPLTEIN